MSIFDMNVAVIDAAVGLFVDSYRSKVENGQPDDEALSHLVDCGFLAAFTEPEKIAMMFAAAIRRLATAEGRTVTVTVIDLGCAWWSESVEEVIHGPGGRDELVDGGQQKATEDVFHTNLADANQS